MPALKRLPALVDGTTGVNGLKERITLLVGKYRASELEQAFGASDEIALAESVGDVPLAGGGGVMQRRSTGVWKRKPSGSFRETEWFKSLSPERQKTVELELLEHIHKTVNNDFSKVFAHAVERYMGLDPIERAKRVQERFGHILADPRYSFLNCLGHTQMVLRLSSLVGFECGPLAFPKHMAALVKTSSGFMVSEISRRRPMPIKIWEENFMRDSTPATREWMTANMPDGVSLFSVAQPLPYFMSPHAADAVAHDILGTLNLEAGRLVTAEEEMRKSLEIHPNRATALSNLGTILSARAVEEHKPELYGEARECLRKAAELWPNSIEIQFNYADILREMGDVAGAKVAYQKTLALVNEMGSTEAARQIKPLLPALKKKLGI